MDIIYTTIGNGKNLVRFINVQPIRQMTPMWLIVQNVEDFWITIYNLLIMPTINDRSYWLAKAKQAEENAKWNLDRAQRALRDGTNAAYKSHMYDAKSYQKDAENYRYIAKQCTK